MSTCPDCQGTGWRYYYVRIAGSTLERLQPKKPLCIDLFCGLGGWAEGFLAEGYEVIGFDVERHNYGTGSYPGQLVLQDVLTLHDSQFRDAAVIVASPPCQEYSYRAMPWKRAKALPPPSNELFDACFRIQREACETAGRYIPLVVENVCGAQRWVGRAKWHYESYYLWGDVPALMPFTFRSRQKFPANCSPRMWSDREVSRLNDGMHHAFHQATKNDGGSWFNVAHNTESGCGRNPVNGTKNRDLDGYERSHPEAFGWKAPRTSSHSNARKAASAMIAKIPFELARHIARCYKPSMPQAKPGERIVRLSEPCRHKPILQPYAANSQKGEAPAQT